MVYAVAPGLLHRTQSPTGILSEDENVEHSAGDHDDATESAYPEIPTDGNCSGPGNKNNSEEVETKPAESRAM